MSDEKQPTRVHYFTGESLNTSDFVAEQDYILHRFQTNISSLNIWGIANGLTVNFANNTILINPGVAFDYDGRTVVLSENYVITLNAEQIESIKSEVVYLIMSYGDTQTDYTKESYVGGFKRIVEMPVFSLQTDLERYSLVLASFQEGKIYYDNRRYCSQELGSLTFASCSKEAGVLSQALPSISGCYETSGSCLRIDSPETLMSGSLTILPNAYTNQSAQTLLTVRGGVEIANDLKVGGTIFMQGQAIIGTQWKGPDGYMSIYYSEGSVIIGKVPSVACTEKLSVYGDSKINGNVICNGAGKKFIGDGSGLTNLPNNPWVLGTAAAQNNIFYPGLGIEGGAAQGAVGIGPFTSLDEVFPDDASLMIKNKAYIQKLSGFPSTEDQYTPEISSTLTPLVISSDLSIQSETGSTTTLSIAKGDFNMLDGNQTITEGNLTLGKGDLNVNGSVTAISYNGDGSRLKGVGYWTMNDTSKVIYYTGRVLVGTSTLPEGSDAGFYAKGKMQTDSLSVAGASQVGALSVTGTAQLKQLSVTGAIVPCAGSTKDSGIQFPANVGGGSDDSAWIRYYSNGTGSQDPCTLEIGVANDTTDNIFLNPSGNVGIGVPSPTSAKLVVADSIAIVRSGKTAQVLTAPEAFSLMSGYVDAQGKVIKGTGFVVEKTGVGDYAVTFNSRYTSQPVVVASLVSNGSSSSTLANAVIVTISPEYFVVLCGDATGKPTDSAFSFMVIG
jgi:hypothetical protein